MTDEALLLKIDEEAAEAILDMSDEEIVEAVKADGEDPETVAADVRSVLRGGAR